MSDFLRIAGAIAGWVWRFFHILWVCRISLLGSVGGGLLLYLTPQSRDLFADLSQDWWYWLPFFFLLFSWGWVVHAVGRRALQADDWMAEAHGPGGLSASRRAALQQQYGGVALWVPRVLGLTVFVLIFLALYDSQTNLKPAAALEEARAAHDLAYWLAAGTAGTALVYLVLVWTRRRAETRLAYGTQTKHEDEPPLLIGLVPFPLSVLHWPTQGPVQDSKLVRSVRIGLFAFALGITLGFIGALGWPHTMAEKFARAIMAPVLFGGVVLVLGELAIWSHRLRTPLLAILTLAGVGLLFWADRFHDVRFVGDPAVRTKAEGATAQIALTEAVERWKSANKCIDTACPRPILITGAGGASRAAFLTASVAGALFDLGPDIRNRVFAMSTVSGSSVGAVVMRAALTDAAAKGAPDTPPCHADADKSAWFGGLPDRPGSSRFRTAPDVTKSWRDCFQLLLAGDFLSPALVGLVFRDNFPLQFGGRPLWGDRAILLEESLERRYRRMTNPKSAVESCKAGDNDGLCRRFGFHPHPRDLGGTWIPLLFINGTSVSTGRRIIAADVPIGKTYGNGERLLPFAYDVNESRNWRTARDRDDSPVGDKIDFCRTASAGKPGETIDNCVRLSTASMLSARFPIISPQGNIRDRSENVRDKIVDGGYFENDGLATIADVAQALKGSFKLDPIVVRVVNDPVKPEATEKVNKLGPDRPLMPDIADRKWFDDILSIVLTLAATRSGHEDGHQAYLEGVLGGKGRLYEVHVYRLNPENGVSSTGAPVSKQRQLTQRAAPQNPLCRRDVDLAKIDKAIAMDTVSMSWWMSHPVQAYLDAQLCVQANWKQLECERNAGRQAPGIACLPD